ncbi:MAG TPA: cytochrome c peroxidase [Saprospiraceae bacterium]|nr:cytochrome c peroxidase [Saprospiraceae bacterium]HNM25665.1 cytochrome c peroxidase [Saprospiraceae bacterium]
MKRFGVLLLLAALLGYTACKPDDPGPSQPGACDLTGIPYNPQTYVIPKPDSFPAIPIPADNPTTLEGVQLGRMLFYDPILSGDSTQSCSSCHLPAGNFTDNKATSKGIQGLNGRRSAMALLNVAYSTKGFFWDGRAATLEEQVLKPVEDPIEMHNTWVNAMEKLRHHPDYPTYFRQAFGISDCSEMNKEQAGRAMAQFIRTLVSSGQSKYDLWRKGEVEFTDEELNGYIMFFDRGRDLGYNLPDAQCFHCHGGETFTTNSYFNNGLDSVASLDDFIDKGRGEVTGNRYHNGQFRSPGLRNITLSAPYMHDGRFQTLEEVLVQYSDNGFGVENEDPFIRQIGFPVGNGQYSGLTLSQQKDIIAFLHTLTDTVFIHNPLHQNPF